MNRVFLNFALSFIITVVGVRFMSISPLLSILILTVGSQALGFYQGVSHQKRREQEENE